MKYPLQVGDQIYFTKVEHDDEQYCAIIKGKAYTLLREAPLYGVHFIDEDGDERNYPLGDGFVEGYYDYELIEEENE